MLEKKDRKRYHTLIFLFQNPNNFFDHFHPFPNHLKCKAIQIEESTKLALIDLHYKLFIQPVSLGLPKCLELIFTGFSHLKTENFPGEDPRTPHIKTTSTPYPATSLWSDL